MSRGWKFLYGDSFIRVVWGEDLFLKICGFFFLFPFIGCTVKLLLQKSVFRVGEFLQILCNWHDNILLIFGQSFLVSLGHFLLPTKFFYLLHFFFFSLIFQKLLFICRALSMVVKPVKQILFFWKSVPLSQIQLLVPRCAYSQKNFDSCWLKGHPSFQNFSDVLKLSVKGENKSPRQKLFFPIK